MIKKMSHMMMWAQNLEKVSKWYNEKLGFTVSYHAPNEFLSLKHEEMGRIDFHSAGNDRSNIGKGPLPYFVVDNIEEVKAWLEAKQIKVGEIQQEGDSPKHAWFWDCEGNTLGLEEI
jgi:catechol 2,3-dioxygenase-like lactoylglutathione lyase family enzyme